MKRLVVILIVLVSVAAVAVVQTGERKFLTSKLAAEQHLPFSSGVLVGDTLYVAGTIADTAKLAAGLSPEQESREVLDQVKQTLNQGGMTMDDVVSVQVFCSDLSLYDAFNGVYKTYFHDNYPARTFVGVAKLLFGAKFEVSAIAVSHAKVRP